MEPHAYEDMSRQQESHWWFRARRDILGQMLEQLPINANPSILEIGCGPGGNLEMLKSIGETTAVELNESAANVARKSSGIPVIVGHLPDNIDTNKKYDLVCLFDVLEHVEHDAESLNTIKALLKKDGVLLLTLPAYQWLFGKHDRILHHYRRYNMKGICDLLDNAGFSVWYATYFNFLLFPLAVIARMMDYSSNTDSSIGYDTPNKFLNSLLYRVFSSEKHLIGKFRIPYGNSLLIIGRA